jgi:hypothetical protein
VWRIVSVTRSLSGRGAVGSGRQRHPRTTGPTRAPWSRPASTPGCSNPGPTGRRGAGSTPTPPAPVGRWST